MIINDELLELSLKKQKHFKKIPDKINNKIFQMIDDEHTKFVKEKKGDVEKKAFTFFDFRLRYAFIAAVFIIVISIPLLLLFILKPDFNIFNRNNLIVEASLKNGSLYKIENDKKNDIKQLKIKKNDFIGTGKKSEALISVGSGSVIKMNENTSIKIVQNDVLNDDEKFLAHLEDGEIECEVKLSSKDSDFSIQVEQGKFSVTGTKFNIRLTENSVKIDVADGEVEFSNYLKTDKKLKKIKNKDVLNRIDSIQNKKIFIRKDYSLDVNNDILKNYNDTFNKLIIRYLNMDKKANDNNAQLFLNELNDFDIKSNSMFTVSLKSEKNQLDKKELIIKKIGKIINGTLNEKDTAVIYNNNKIYISSNLNKSIYCINPYNRKLTWSFSHPELFKITSSAVFYDNKLIIPTPDLIFILNTVGELKDKISISQGPSYWAVSKIVDNKLFIPGFKKIFTYDGNTIKEQKNIGDINGQIYFSYSSGKLFMNCMSDKKIKIYSIKDEKYIWESSKLNDRSFVKPLAVDYNIFTADVSGNIYKFNYKNNSMSVIKTSSGITSDLIYNHGHIYFIANDGNFYKLSTSKFNKPFKIAEVDKNPNLEKYLVKKMLVHNDDIYYAGDSKGLFHYNVRNSRINYIKDKNEDLTLVGSPIIIRNRIYVFDNKGNLYHLMENKKN